MSGDKRFRLVAAFKVAGQNSSLSSTKRQVRNRSHERGLTLIEVMLVLGLMVVIASFCWPAINQAFSSQRLKKSADIVRTQWCKSRVKAMSGDRIVLFRYEMNGSRFRIEQIEDSLSSGSLSNDGTTTDPNATSNTATLSDPSQNTPASTSDLFDYASTGVQSLPNGIVFRGGEIENDSRAMTATTPSTETTTGVNWSAPIYFYPDGTSSSAQLQICNDRNFGIELALRGLTGVVKVGDVAATGGPIP